MVSALQRQNILWPWELKAQSRFYPLPLPLVLKGEGEGVRGRNGIGPKNGLLVSNMGGEGLFVLVFFCNTVKLTSHRVVWSGNIDAVLFKSRYSFVR